MAAAGNIEALWAIKFNRSVEVSVQRMAGGRGGRGGPKEAGVPEAWAHTLSLLAPELLDCDRCGNGCKGGFVWDAFLTVLKNSECLAALSSHGGGRMGWVLFLS